MKTWIFYRDIMEVTLWDHQSEFLGSFSATAIGILIFFVDFLMNAVGPGYDFDVAVYAVSILCTLFYPITLFIIMLPFFILEACLILLNRYVFKLEETK